MSKENENHYFETKEKSKRTLILYVKGCEFVYHLEQFK